MLVTRSGSKIGAGEGALERSRWGKGWVGSRWLYFLTRARLPVIQSPLDRRMAIALYMRVARSWDESGGGMDQQGVFRADLAA